MGGSDSKHSQQLSSVEHILVSDATKKELDKVFKKFDVNKDGKISKKEFLPFVFAAMHHFAENWAEMKLIDFFNVPLDHPLWLVDLDPSQLPLTNRKISPLYNVMMEDFLFQDFCKDYSENSKLFVPVICDLVFDIVDIDHDGNITIKEWENFNWQKLLEKLKSAKFAESTDSLKMKAKDKVPKVTTKNEVIERWRIFGSCIVEKGNLRLTGHITISETFEISGILNSEEFVFNKKEDRDPTSISNPNPNYMVGKIVGYETRPQYNQTTGRYENKSVAIKKETPIYNNYKPNVPHLGRAKHGDIITEKSSLLFHGENHGKFDVVLVINWVVYQGDQTKATYRGELKNDGVNNLLLLGKSENEANGRLNLRLSRDPANLLITK